MKNQTLSIEQMRHLKELCVDTSKASMKWKKLSGKDCPCTDKSYYYIGLTSNHSVYEVAGVCSEKIPAFTLQDIIELLPKEIKTEADDYLLTISIYDCKEWYVCYSMSDEFDYYKEFKSESLLEASYQMLCWCAENGYLNNNKI